MRNDSKETTITSLNPGINGPATAEESDRNTALVEVMFWSAALMETLVLVGGLAWILNGPREIGLPARIGLVALGAVLSGSAFVWAAGKRFADTAPQDDSD